MKEIEELIRPELLVIKPYSSARDEFTGKAQVYIDANENPYDNKYNRYPDPLQRALKAEISKIKSIDSNKIFLGNGSDEVLDLIFRLFCVPGKDKILITPPTYGMYKVLAAINNVGVDEILLTEDFQIDLDKIADLENNQYKLIFLCSPNNPVGNCLDKGDVIKILQKFSGIVVIDEAYIDFANEEGYLEWVDNFPNLIVTQTFSKAWGMAGIRLGMAFCNEFIVKKLNGIKPPYNVNSVTQEIALSRIKDLETFKIQVETIQAERESLRIAIEKLDCVLKVHPSEANFLLAKFENADYYYNQLINQGIVVRNRSNLPGCENCLRITVGTPGENIQLVSTLSKIKKPI